MQDIFSFMAGRPEERKITPVSDEDTKCLTCSSRIRTLREAVSEWPVFKLALPAAAADAKAVPKAEPAAADAEVVPEVELAAAATNATVVAEAKPATGMC